MQMKMDASRDGLIVVDTRITTWNLNIALQASIFGEDF